METYLKQSNAYSPKLLDLALLVGIGGLYLN